MSDHTWSTNVRVTRVYGAIYESSYDGPVSFENYASFVAHHFGLKCVEFSNVEYRFNFVSRRAQSMLRG